MPVVFSEFHHAVLNDVERGFIVTNVEGRSLECAPLDTFQEI
jgi:hypothetical protein